ncbi:MAG: hypothetical protein ACIAXF_10525 [Phycisphaerales bacterium JB063]
MSDQAPNTPSTLGQRIDALLGPLEIEAHQYREAIELGKAQVQQLQNKIAQAEQALAGIETQMGEVLDSLAHNEPLLARMAGAVNASQPVEQHAPPAETPPAPEPQPEPTPAAAPEPLALSAPAGEPSVEPGDERSLPTPEEDAQAVDEIEGILSEPAEQAAAAAAGSGSLASVAARAEQAAQRLSQSLSDIDR